MKNHRKIPEEADFQSRLVISAPIFTGVGGGGGIQPPSNGQFQFEVHWSTTIIPFQRRQLLFASGQGLNASSFHLFSGAILWGKAPAVERSL
jgi:hypothetical protein